MIRNMLLCILCLLPVSCGYHFAGMGDAVDPSIRDVYVAPFKNSTPEPLIENYVRNAFVEQLRYGGRFSVAGSSETCDADISGTVTAIRTSRATYRVAESAVEDRVSMSLDITFQDSTGEILWSRRNYSGTETYRVTDDASATERSRKDALRKCAEDLAEKAYRDMMSGF